MFLSLIPLIIESELNHARSVFQGGEEIRGQLLAYLQGIQERFEDSPQVRFWVRILFIPPVHLYDQVMQPMHVFMDDLEDTIRQSINNSPLRESSLGVETQVIACMAMVDSLQSELLFGGVKKYQRRLASVWAVFEAALRADCRC